MLCGCSHETCFWGCLSQKSARKSPRGHSHILAVTYRHVWLNPYYWVGSAPYPRALCPTSRTCCPTCCMWTRTSAIPRSRSSNIPGFPAATSCPTTSWRGTMPRTWSRQVCRTGVSLGVWPSAVGGGEGRGLAWRAWEAGATLTGEGDVSGVVTPYVFPATGPRLHNSHRLWTDNRDQTL